MKLPPREFIFLRHGETDYNRERRFQGRIDVALNATGRNQAARAAAILAGENISRVVASPARRVLQTVEPLLQVREMPLHVDDDLMEFFVGGFEGRLIAEIHDEHGLGDEGSWMSVLPNDAGSWEEFVSTVMAAVARWTGQHPGETVLIASHGLVFQALSESLLGERLTSRNAEPYRFRPLQSGWAASPLSADLQAG